MDYQKELKESLGFGLIFATIKAGIDYAMHGRKPSITAFCKNGGIAACADIAYDFGKQKKWWPWI